jgi:hypothetical protein
MLLFLSSGAYLRLEFDEMVGIRNSVSVYWYAVAGTDSGVRLAENGRRGGCLELFLKICCSVDSIEQTYKSC